MTGDTVLRSLEHNARMRRIEIFLDDIHALADELEVRAPDGELHSMADNEWVFTERGRLLQMGYELLREVWLNREA